MEGTKDSVYQRLPVLGCRSDKTVPALFPLVERPADMKFQNNSIK